MSGRRARGGGGGRALVALAVTLLVGALPSSRLAAQGDPLARAHELERQGRLEEAAAAFRQVLARAPANNIALLGAERVMTALGERDSLLALARRAIEADPRSVTARQVEVRTARALGGEVMAAEALRRWVEAAPASEAPYRELVRGLLARGRLDEARTAVESARARIGNPAALRPELAQVEIAAGDWARAAELWRAEVLDRPEVLSAAVFNLQNAQPQHRERVVRVVVGSGGSALPRRLAAELLLAWGQPARAWELLQSALPASPDERIALVRAFADRARGMEQPEALRVAGAAFEYMAGLLSGAEAARWRVESARAYSQAADAPSARRVLRAMTDDPAAPAGASASASATLVELLLRERNPSEAQRLLEQQRRRLPGTEAARLAHLVARGWIVQGDLDRAEAVIRSDSSLAADEIRGWVALYRGDLARARRLLRSAGAGGAGRDGATERAAMAALLQAVDADSAPDLGAALLAVARGDTVRGARAVAAVARRPGHGGTPELLAHAAQLLFTADPAAAEEYWIEIAERHTESAPAPAALLALARMTAARGDLAASQRRLEQLIIQYPHSALVPEARRELDRVRGLVPRG